MDVMSGFIKDPQLAFTRFNLKSMKVATLLLLFVLDSNVKGDSFQCYSCTYTRSSDPSINYECVTAPQNFTIGQVTIMCTTPYQCVTKTLYNQDMTNIRSVTRSCQPQHDICEGKKCCNNAGVYPSCEYKCRDSLCNDNNPEEHFRSSDDTGDGSSMAPCVSLIILATMYSYFPS